MIRIKQSAIAAFVVALGVCQAWSAPNTTQPNIQNMLLSQCIQNAQVQGGGTGSNPVCYTVVTGTDANLNIASTTSMELTPASLSAIRTWTLPSASSYGKGNHLFIADIAGAITGGNTITLARAGADTINGATTFSVATQYAVTELVSDGTSKWAVQVASGSGSVTSVGTSGGATGGPITTTGTIAGAAIPGAVINLVANLTAAGSSITVTADAVNVATALNGSIYTLPSYSQTFNGAGTGAGGMDTGAIPTSGWLALYAIYNPSGPTTSILGFNCSSACGTIYPGAHMPAGYTASALLATLPTNATPAIKASRTLGRHTEYAFVSALSSSASSATCTSLSLATSVPPNAIAWTGFVEMVAGTSPSGNINMNVWPDSACALGLYELQTGTASITNFPVGVPFPRVPMPTSQTTYYSFTNSGTSGAANIDVFGYDIPSAQ